jgi:hypothetical protein
VKTVWIFLLLLAGCGDGPPTPFAGDPTAPTFDHASQAIQDAAPEGPYCKVGTDGKYVGLKTGIARKGKRGEIFFAEGGGCIERPMREVWAVSHNPQIAAWRESDLISFKQSVDKRVDFYFVSHHEAGPSFPFVGRTNWDMEWFQTLTEGDLDRPEHVVVKYLKHKGTSHIVFWEGSFELKALTESVTSFAMRNEVRGTRIDVDKAAGGVTDLFARLKTLPPDYRHLGE